MDSRTFYDEFVGRQTAVGVNERHRAIVAWLRRFGLRPTHSVLEIGCGVGTVTQLLAAEVRHGGSVLGVDLSPKSIEAARERLAAFPHARVETGDAIEMDVGGPFDVVVLPDVIEHIPLELHSRLFARVASWLVPDGFALLHYPNPHHLDWYHKHDPQALQFIDQPIHANVLLSNAYPHGLYLDFLQTYSIWIREGDYVVAVLRPVRPEPTFTPLPSRPLSLFRRFWRRARKWLS
jgi:cyclopropane fatty-acyl-phospholipid synthase-like methyltransferase